MNNLIQLSNLNKTFVSEKKINVLRKVNYKFKKGKIYSLIGPSGSGKSTLLNLLSLIDCPSSGSISIGNNQIDFNNSKKNDILRANKIGIIYQQDNLLTDFTAIENIYLASLAAGKDKETSISKSKVLSLNSSGSIPNCVTHNLMMHSGTSSSSAPCGINNPFKDPSVPIIKPQSSSVSASSNVILVFMICSLVNV